MFFAPATSVNVPKFVVPFVIPETVAVPDFVMLPDASGVPAVGRTWMLENTTLHLVVFGFPSRALSVNVIVPEAGVAVVEVNEKQVPVPAVLVTVAVTETPVLKENPEGVFIIKVPLAGKS